MISDAEEKYFADVSEHCDIPESYEAMLHREQTFAMQIAENHYQAKVARLRALVERNPKPLSVPKHEPIVDRKSLAAGDSE